MTELPNPTATTRAADRSAQAAKERGAFKAQQVRAETGLGASVSSGH